MTAIRHLILALHFVDRVVKPVIRWVSLIDPEIEKLIVAPLHQAIASLDDVFSNLVFGQLRLKLCGAARALLASRGRPFSGGTETRRDL